MSAISKSPYERAKKYNRFGKFFMDDLRREIRNDFINKLRAHRQSCIDKERKLRVNDAVRLGYNEIRKNLLADKEAVELLDQNKLISLLINVQEEILNEELQQQAEQHEEDLQQEIDAIVNNSLTKCTVCEKMIDVIVEPNIICDSCVKHFENDG